MTARSTPTKSCTALDAAKIPLNVSESDIVKLILEFLEFRGLHIAQISLERETGIINGAYSSDALFLRQLIIDGNWDAALEFVDPLKDLCDFDYRRFKYFLLKYKYFELLCIKNEPGYMYNNEFTVEELVECLQSLEPLCPNADDYRSLCALLTLPRLGDHAQFARWNPSGARIECFTHVYPLVNKFLLDSTLPSSYPSSALLGSSKSERLMQLVIRGLLYENCVDLCQNKAVRAKEFDEKLLRNSLLLDSTHPLDLKVDGSLYSWLKCVPVDVFSLPFVKEFLDIKVDALRRPQLEAQWTEQILATPIKPKMFPHSATPISRLKSAEKMSLSMIPQYETLSCGLDKSDSFIEPGRRLEFATNGPRSSMLSQSIAVGFQISGKNTNLMQQSAIDVLLETSPDTRGSAGARAPNVILQENEIPKEMQMSYSQQQQQMQSSMYRSMTARQQLEDIKRKTLPANVQYMEPQQDSRRRAASENESPSQPVMGKLYQEFNKQRINRGASEPPPAVSNADAMAYQMMQMSFYAGRQGQQPQTGTSLTNLHNGHLPMSESSRMGVSTCSPNVVDVRAPPVQTMYPNESMMHSRIVAKRQIQQAFGGKKVTFGLLKIKP